MPKKIFRLLRELCSRSIPCLGRVSTFLYFTLCPTYTLALALAHELTPPQRSELRPREGVNIFQGRHVDGPLSDFVDLSSSTSTDGNVKSLGKLFAFAKGLWQSLFQPVILIRAVFLKDATVLRFITQHPLCDASGMVTPVSSLGLDIAN
jgi:hypothetical protein